MKERDQAKKDAINSLDLWQAYKTLRNKVTKAIRDALQSYYLGIIDENRENPKRMWKAVNKVLNRDTNSVGVSSLNIEGRTLTKEKDIAEALNQHFVTVGPKLAEKLESKNDDDPLVKINAQTKNLKFKLIDNTYVLNAISRLKNGKAPGPDKISTRLVKDSGDFIGKPLTMIYNSSLETGVFPDIWKLASVTPIFKAGPRNDANNYRPISVISIFSRILEKIVHDQMVEFLQPIFTKNQAAFRKLYSTVTSLINSTDSWYSTIDRKEVNLAIFLDLKKAFDTVDHTILLVKLEKYGIRGITGDWFTSYLRNRKQFCTVDGHKSSAKMVTCGIPQGSCLGPLLFIIYLNDFETCLELSKASMYADDTHVTITSNNLENLLENAQRELLNISEWMRINKLTANPKKTEYMLIGHPRKVNKLDVSEPLILNNSEIKRAKKTKSLGVIVDEGLNWEQHFKVVKGKVRGGLSSLKKLKNLVPQKQLDNVYRALIESHLRYANVIWGSIPSSKIKILQNLQDRARTIIERARIKDDWSYNWLNVEQLIKFDRSTMTYKIMNRMCPESLWDKFPQISLHSNYNTRNCKDIQIPRYNLEYVKKGFHYSALTAWNSIPISIRELPTFPQFKRNLKTHLKS